jgi:hypothetical protein
MTVISFGSSSAGIPDPFGNLASLRLSQDFIGETSVKKLLTTVPVRKPHKHDFVRVRPEAEYRETFGLIQLGNDREFYLVSPGVAGELAGEYAPYTIYTAMTRQGTLFLWPVRLPGPDGKLLEWWRSAHEAANRATRDWVRVSADLDLGAYEIRVAEGQMPGPEWPEYAFLDLIRVAFQNRLVDRRDHEVIRQLRGLT